MLRTKNEAPRISGVLRLALALLAAACSSGSGSRANPGGDSGTDGTALDGAAGDGNTRRDASGDGSMSDSGGPTTCSPNATVPCKCTNAGEVGMQQCLPDGTAWRACACESYGTQIAVSPTGSDTAAGTLAAPFRTLGRAQTAVRALVDDGGMPKASVVVWLRGGTYEIDAAFTLTASDSGTTTAPVIWSGYPGESANLVGGKALPPSGFSLVTSSSPVWSRFDPSAQGHIMRVNLPAQGVTDYGTLVESGSCAYASQSALELSINGAAMPLARWPDATDDTPAQTDTGSTLTVYGTGVVPDVTGAYTKTGTADGVSQYARTGLVGGKQFNLYRWTNGSTTAWFLTTTASGYPTNTDPWWYLYTPDLGVMTANNGASGAVSFTDPTAIDHGFSTVSSVVSPTQFGFLTTRPARWTQAKDPWVHGLFYFDWADCHENVTAIDTAGQTMTLGASPAYGIKATQLWYAENLLEEITVPGEWYLDRTSGDLYLWPPSSLTAATIVVSTLTTPLLEIQGASNVTFRALTLEAGRAQLVDVSKGTNISLLGVTLRNAGTAGATLDGTNVGVSYAHLYGTGGQGISLSGGDRPSLTAGNNFVEDSNIHDFGRWSWMYQPGISLNDDGNRASNNKIHDSPHAAILYGGNNHTIELNDIYDACQYTADAGAIYSGRDWGARGNVIRNNYLHAINSFLSTDVSAIYLDDCLSGILVQGNIVDGVGSFGVLHGGGRDDIMTDNVLARCGNAALSADARCFTGLSQGAPNDTPGDSWNLLAKLEAENYQKDPWASAFPACAAIPDDWNTIIAPDGGWLLPQGSEFSRNLGFANGRWIAQEDTYAIPAYSAVSNNLSDAGNVFVNEEAGNLSLTDASVAQVPGLKTVPFGTIGIQR
jgi:hypothetical protein